MRPINFNSEIELPETYSEPEISEIAIDVETGCLCLCACGGSGAGSDGPSVPIGGGSD